MTDDYRVKTSWRAHPKRAMVSVELGAPGVLAIMDLWSFAASDKTDGDLSGMSDRAIATAAGWTGKPSDLMDCLTDPDIRLIDGDAGERYLHDWEDNQPWVAGFEDRRTASKKANDTRWHKQGRHEGIIKKGCPLCSEPDSGSIRSGSEPEEIPSAAEQITSDSDPRRSDPESPFPYLSSPSLADSSPTRIEPYSLNQDKAAKEEQPRKWTNEVLRVFDRWCSHRGQFRTPTFSCREWGMIEALLNTGVTVETLLLAVDGAQIATDRQPRARDLASVVSDEGWCHTYTERAPKPKPKFRSAIATHCDDVADDLDIDRLDTYVGILDLIDSDEFEAQKLAIDVAVHHAGESGDITGWGDIASQIGERP